MVADRGGPGNGPELLPEAVVVVTVTVYAIVYAAARASPVPAHWRHGGRFAPAEANHSE